MFDWLFERNRRPATSGFSPSSASPPESTRKDLIDWLAADDPANPFPGQRVLDCRPLALTLMSTTSDPAIAQRFLDLRADDGRTWIGQFHEPLFTRESDLGIPYDGSHDDGPLYRAQEMEDKWDVDADGGRLYLRRSWTGQLIYVAEIDYRPDAVLIHRLHCNGGAVDENPAYA